MPSKIEWLNLLPGYRGETWNPVTGCSKVSQGCKNCYAEGNAIRFWGKRKFTDVISHTLRLETPLHWKKPRLIFVNSMSDLFHEAVSFEFIEAVYSKMMEANRHIYIILTKRPERALKFFEWLKPRSVERRLWDKVKFPLPQIWLGVSVEDQETADERIPLLLQIPAAVRLVSYEPALGEVNFKKYLPVFKEKSVNYTDGLDWVICGGESGHGARPMHPEWARKVRNDCIAAGVPFFFKQWGEWEPIDNEQIAMSDKYKIIKMDMSGYFQPYPLVPNNANINMMKSGKKASGRELDGMYWNQYPAAATNSEVVKCLDCGTSWDGKTCCPVCKPKQ